MKLVQIKILNENWSFIDADLYYIKSLNKLLLDMNHFFFILERSK